MKRKRFLFLLFIFLSYIPVLAQVDTAWVRTYTGNSLSFDQPRGMRVDLNGNVYVTGFVTLKGNYFDYATIKYSSTGEVIWTKNYNGKAGTIDIANDLAIDDSGNVYVTGGSGLFNLDYLTIKYSSTGKNLWTKYYNGPENNTDVAWAIATDKSRNVYVTGRSVGKNMDDYATIKYAPNGDTLWIRRYDGSGQGNDSVNALAIDDSGNVYVSGASWNGASNDISTIKYSPTGDILWFKYYDGPGKGRDAPNDLIIDKTGNVYVTGESWGLRSRDFTTIKYSPASDPLWVRFYDGPGRGKDVARALVLDSTGNIYVTGDSWGSGTNYDYVTIKYAPNGDTLWVRRYNGIGNGADSSLAITLDDSGNVYVTGSSWNGTSSDYLTIKYSPGGEEVWVKSYNGSGNGDDQAVAIAVDKQRNIYITGTAFLKDTGRDFVSIKYIPKK